MPKFEELIKEQGGYGRFQFLSYILIALSLNMTGMLIYNLPYLLLLPKFAC